MITKLFLDTCSINALSGLDERGFNLLRSLLEKNKSELYASSVQVDERYTKKNLRFEHILEKAFKIFNQNEIKINLVPTKGGIWGVSRWDLFTFTGEDLGRINDELREELKKCMEEKGKYQSKPFDEQAKLNIARDCLIAITSSDYDYFITSDDCLYRSWGKILEKNETKRILIRVPKIVYVEPCPDKILNQIVNVTGLQNTA